MFQAIPKAAAPKVSKTTQPVTSSFVCLSDKADFDIQLQYPLLQMENAVSKCYVRQEVYDRLLEAQRLLPAGYRLRIWDGWRPFALQKELYEKYAEHIIRQFGLTNASAATKKRVIAKYVSFPSRDVSAPPVHTTGGAVDVTILNAEGQELDMGTGFDEFSDKAHTRYYEKTTDFTHIRDNRRMLYHCMISAGFRNLPSEWWHYDFGDGFWAYYNQTPALYQGVYTEEELVCK